jgi:hypothetical protein
MAEGAEAFFHKPLDFGRLQEKIVELTSVRVGKGAPDGR